MNKVLPLCYERAVQFMNSCCYCGLLFGSLAASHAGHGGGPLPTKPLPESRHSPVQHTLTVPWSRYIAIWLAA